MFQQLKYVIRSDNLISIEKMDINNPFFFIDEFTSFTKHVKTINMSNISIKKKKILQYKIPLK